MTDTAYINGAPFPYFPNSLNWDYSLNTASFDTLGGRVVQVLSVKVESLTLQGDAGSRANLQLLYLAINDLQNSQIQSQNSCTLSLPSRNWSFQVWIHSFPQFGWDYKTVTYPYQLQMEVDMDSGIPDELSASIVGAAFSNLQDSIGFDTTWNGLNPTGQQGVDQMLNSGGGDPLSLPPISTIQQELNSINNASGTGGPAGS